MCQALLLADTLSRSWGGEWRMESLTGCVQTPGTQTGGIMVRNLLLLLELMLAGKFKKKEPAIGEHCILFFAVIDVLRL